MKINALEISGYKGIKVLNYAPSTKRTVLYGKNGAGKSSFIEALNAMMTGSQINEDAINVNTQEMFLHAQVDNQLPGTNNKALDYTILKRPGKPTKFTMNGKTTSNKEIIKEIEDVSQVNSDTNKIMSLGTVLDSLDKKDFAGLVTSYIPQMTNMNEISASVMKSSYSSKNPINEEITKFTSSELTEVCNLISAYFPKGSDFDISLIKDVKEAIAEQLKLIKIAIQKEQALLSTYSSIPGTRPLSDIIDDEKEVDKQLANRDILVKAKSSYDTIVATRTKQLAYIDELNNAIKSITVTSDNAEEKAAIEKELATLQTMIKSIERTNYSLSMMINSTTEKIGSLSGCKCPLDPTISCDLKGRKEILAKCEQEINDAKDSLAASQKQLADLVAKETSLKDNMSIMDKEALLYERKINLVKTLEQAKLNVPVMPNAPEPIQSDEELKEKKINLDKEKLIAESYDKYNQEMAKLLTNVKQYHLFNCANASLALKGIVMEDIMSKYTTILNNYVNSKATLGQKDVEINFVFDEGLVPYMKTKANGVFIPYSLLSSGEKIYVSFFILDMINSISQKSFTDEFGNDYMVGFRIMTLDKLEQLDLEAFESIVELTKIKEIDENYDLFVFSAVERPDFLDYLKNQPVDLIKM